MILWLCSALAVGGGVAATFLNDLRRSILSLWLCSLGVGGVYLSLGAETLAVMQWIVSTLMAISFVFYAVTFGEYGTVEAQPLKQRLISAVAPVVLGFGFIATVALGAKEFPGMIDGNIRETPSLEMGPRQGQDMLAVGQALTTEHLLSLELIALTLLLVIVGSGVIARPDAKEALGDRESP